MTSDIPQKELAALVSLLRESRGNGVYPKWWGAALGMAQESIRAAMVGNWKLAALKADGAMAKEQAYTKEPGVFARFTRGIHQTRAGREQAQKTITSHAEPEKRAAKEKAPRTKRGVRKTARDLTDEELVQLGRGVEKVGARPLAALLGVDVTLIYAARNKSRGWAPQHIAKLMRLDIGTALAPPKTAKTIQDKVQDAVQAASEQYGASLSTFMTEAMEARCREIAREIAREEIREFCSQAGLRRQ